MVLRNLLSWFVLFFVITDFSHGFPKQESLTIRDTAKYIQKNSYFYNNDQYKDILIKSINTINSYSDNVLIKIKWGSNSKFEVQGNDIRGNLIVEEYPFNAKNIKDVGIALTQLISNLKEFNAIQLNDVDDLYYLVANTMLQHVDEYSSIIHPDLFDDFLIESKGSFGGLGIVIGIRDEKLTIISPIEGTPADKIGVKANDKISRIEDFDTEGFTLEQAIKLLRGEKGTPITIFVERENVPELIEFNIVRDIIKIKSIESKSLKNNIGYIKINTFQSNTYEEFISSLESLRQKGINSLILDLRGNPGGLFGQALKISNVFLKEKLIVSTKSKTKEMNFNFFTSPYETPKFDGPLIILTDGGSASASEIVTGAIKNNERGIIIGQQTFGKGTVQEVYSQEDGSGVKLTIAEYLSPENYKVHLNGIKPDINFIPIKLEENRLLSEKEIEIQLYDNNMTTKVNSDDIEKSKFNIIYSPKKLKEDDEDELISFSKYILNSDLISKVQFNNNINSFLSILESRISPEAKKISESFSRKLKNFSSAKNNFKSRKNYNLENKVNIKKQDKIKFTPGINKEINVSVVNKSDKPLSNIIIKSESDNKTFDNKYFYVGEIKASKKTDLEISFNLPSWIKSSDDILNLSLLQLDMSQALRPTLLKISGTEIDIEVVKDKFTFPKFTYSITPIKQKEQINFELNVETINEPLDCDKCYIHVLSNDKQLIIKNKKHKISSQNNKNLGLKSNLSIGLDDIKNDKIKFAIRFHDENTRAIFDKDITINKDEIISYDTKSKTYKIILNTLAYSEPSDDGIILGQVKQGSVFNSLGETQNFILVSSGKKEINLWLKKTDLEPVESMLKNSKFINLTRMYEEPPQIYIQSTVKNNIDKVNIEAVVSDESKIKNINYFLNDEKIRLDLPNKKIINENFQINLKPGRNKLYIVASDTKGIKTFKEIYLTKNEN